MTKHILLMSLLLASNISHAGFKGLTMHSRGNCANNESISWDATQSWRLGTNSIHLDKYANQHKFGAGIQNTWRSAAVHWGEGTGGYTVYGEHYLFHPGTNTLKDYQGSYAYDCRWYDGWWD